MPGLSESPLLQRTIDVQYATRKRAAATKWTLVNGTLLVIFAYDLWCKCPGYTSPLHVVELCVASALAASLLLHVRWLLPSRERALDVTTRQLHLLGLSDQQLDSSFRLIDTSTPPSAPSDNSRSLDDDVSVLSLSLSLSQSRGGGGGGGGSPGAGDVSWSRSSPHVPEDQFIADSDSLTDYLRQYQARTAAQASLPPSWLPPTSPSYPGGAGGAGGVRARHYQLSLLDADTSPGGAESGGGGSGAGSGGEPRVWRSLNLDPHHLTQYNLNLRLWLHVTILARLVREVDSINDALHKHHLPDVTIGEVSVERLRRTAAALGGAGGAAGGGALHSLLPFLEPFPEQRYLLQRIRELATGGCLGQYKWDRGGSDWDDTKPTDSEILYHLFTTYLESQLDGGGAGAGAGARAAAGAGGAWPRVVRAAPATQPPHYLLQLKDETIEVCRGRNNLLHTLLVWVAAAAAARAGGRLQLGPAGLNLLWVIGR